MFIFYPLVFVFNFIKLSLSKISFLHSLKVKIIFCMLLSTMLLWDVCRLHPTPEKFSRLLKTFEIRQQERTGIPKCLLCRKHWVRSSHHYYFMFLLHLTMWKQESNPVVLFQPALSTNKLSCCELVCGPQACRGPGDPPPPSQALCSRLPLSAGWT